MIKIVFLSASKTTFIITKWNQYNKEIDNIIADIQKFSQLKVLKLVIKYSVSYQEMRPRLINNNNYFLDNGFFLVKCDAEWMVFYLKSLISYHTLLKDTVICSIFHLILEPLQIT